MRQFPRRFEVLGYGKSAQRLAEEFARLVHRLIQGVEILLGKYIEGVIHSLDEAGLGGRVLAGGDDLVAPFGINGRVFLTRQSPVPDRYSPPRTRPARRCSSHPRTTAGTRSAARASQRSMTKIAVRLRLLIQLVGEHVAQIRRARPSHHGGEHIRTHEPRKAARPCRPGSSPSRRCAQPSICSSVLA